MRPLPLLLLSLILAAPAGALPRLIQPDGTAVWLFSRTDAGAVTWEFPRGAVPEESWLTLASSGPGWVEVLASGGRTRLTVPDVKIPGLRATFRVPRGLRSVVWHGRGNSDQLLVRSEAPPVGPGAVVRLGSSATRVDLPEWKVPDGYLGQLVLELRSGGPSTVSFGGGGERKVLLSGREDGWRFSPQAWGFSPRNVTVSGSAPLGRLRVAAVGPEAPIPADPDTLLAWPADQWRRSDREWFAWSGTSVLVLLTRDYRVQDSFLRRLAFFVEKTGYRGRVVSDQELGDQHGWNAHDYAAPDLAAFFTQAAADGFALLPEETELRDRLVASGILVAGAPGVWTAGTGALVGISAQSPPALRRALFVHEGFHGLYFTSPEFRQGTASVWAGLTEGTRQAFRSFLARSAYDPSFEALMVNEFQAYVLQRDEAGWAPFFRDRVLGGAAPKGRALSQLTELMGAARTLDGLVNTLYGLSSGRISTVTMP